MPSKWIPTVVGLSCFDRLVYCKSCSVIVDIVHASYRSSRFGRPYCRIKPHVSIAAHKWQFILFECICVAYNLMLLRLTLIHSLHIWYRWCSAACDRQWADVGQKVEKGRTTTEIIRSVRYPDRTRIPTNICTHTRTHTRQMKRIHTHTNSSTIRGSYSSQSRIQWNGLVAERTCCLHH